MKKNQRNAGYFFTFSNQKFNINKIKKYADKDIDK